MHYEVNKSYLKFLKFPLKIIIIYLLVNHDFFGNFARFLNYFKQFTKLCHGKCI